MILNENDSDIDVVIKVGGTKINRVTGFSFTDNVQVLPKSIQVDINDIIGGTEHLVDIADLVDAYRQGTRKNW